MFPDNRQKIIIIFLALAFLGASVAAFLFWLEIKEFEPEVYYYVPPERSFIYGEAEMAEFGFEEYIQERITIEKAKLIEREKSFIYLDLKEMRLTLYKEGQELKTLPVLGKGIEGSWWETAPGAYFVGDKVANHFSTMYRVWMPYAVQFYGNFFIHGWPYYTGGRPLPPGPSGGCVRLNTPDAAVVFGFAERGMPVLVFEEKDISPLPALLPLEETIPVPDVKSQAALVADLDTGEMLLGKEIDSEIYAGFLAPGMLALAASEVINLERRIIARDWMVAGVGEKIIVPGRSYRGHDLLSLLLLHASKEAAQVLSRFFTPEYFMAAMNAKARAIGMNNTNFGDITGISEENRTTLYDAARMMRYIKDYRGFIFEISREWPGPGEDETESILAVLKMKTSDNASRAIFVGIADSENAKEGLENIRLWLNNNFGLE